MATQTVERHDQATVIVSITPTIAKEFRRREVFPDLRCMGNAHGFETNGTGHYKTNIHRARELLADAERMRLGRSELPRGAAVAYSYLWRHLKEDIDRAARKGLWVDPGLDEAIRRHAESPARFEVGDRVLCFVDDDENGFEVVIVGGYQMRCVSEEDGPYIGPDGKRVRYRYGYTVRNCGKGDQGFVAAHRLTRDDCKPSHLQLVSAVARSG